jgi:hypothetical protein
MDIVLAMPVAPEQILIGLTMIVCLVGASTAITLKQPFGAVILLIVFTIILWFCFIAPIIISVMPDPSTLPQPWRDTQYTMMHPETWFNITVVWPNGDV